MNTEYIPTGIPGVDEILTKKGFPKGHSILVSGGPGSGKSTFAIQYLYNGAIRYNEPGIFVTLDEEPDEIRVNMLNFEWNLKELEDMNKLHFINISPVRISPSDGLGILEEGIKEFRMVNLTTKIDDIIEKIDAKRIVIDPITMFTIQYPDETERIYAMRDLLRYLKTTNCTTLLISELKGTGLDREYQFEEYLTQGIILLRTHLSGNKLIRVFQVAKMRGLNIDTQPHPYEICPNGIEVDNHAILY